MKKRTERCSISRGSARELGPLGGYPVAQLVEQAREPAAAALDHGRELVAEGDQQADALDRRCRAPASRVGVAVSRQSRRIGVGPPSTERLTRTSSWPAGIVTDHA